MVLVKLVRDVLKIVRDGKTHAHHCNYVALVVAEMYASLIQNAMIVMHALLTTAEMREHVLLLASIHK